MLGMILKPLLDPKASNSPAHSGQGLQPHDPHPVPKETPCELDLRSLNHLPYSTKRFKSLADPGLLEVGREGKGTFRNHRAMSSAWDRGLGRETLPRSPPKPLTTAPNPDPPL